jgi:hypothetical protein
MITTRTTACSTLVALLICLPVLASAYTGGKVSNISTTVVYNHSLAAAANVSYTVETLNLTPTSADTVIHVQTKPDGDYVAGNDDCCSGTGRSRVTIAASGTSRSLWIIVRAYSNGYGGTATLRITPSTGGFTDIPISFGGYVLSNSLNSAFPTSFVSQGHFFTVEQQTGANLTNILVISGAAAYASAYDEQDGIGTMSWLHLVTACSSGCKVVIGRTAASTSGPTTLIWDEDVHYFTSDADGLGDALEVALGTSKTIVDTDGDGLSDSAEVIGVGGGGTNPDVKLPYYGANPLAKDLFLEADWQVCTIATEDCADPGDIEFASYHQLNAQDALTFANFFQPEVSIHIDNGVPNVDPATRTIFGNWGGATQISTTAGYCNPGNAALTASRLGYFRFGGLALGGQGGPGYCYAANEHSHGAHAQEIGHTLGLGHGGPDGAIGDANCKPHYRSPQNYEFQEDVSITDYSHGQFLASPLNPTNLNEVAGLGSSDPSVIGYLENGLVSGGGPGFALQRAADGITLTGAVDWNRDGVFSTSTKGAPTWSYYACEQSQYHRDFKVGKVSGSTMSQHPTLAWLQSAQWGNRLYLISRDKVIGTLEYRYASSFTNCSIQDLNAPCTIWSPGVTSDPKGVPSSSSGTGAPTAVQVNVSGINKLLVVYPNASNSLKSQLLTLVNGTTESWSSQLTIGTGTTDPALVNDGGVIRMFTGNGGVLFEYDYTPSTNTWSAAIAQAWDDDGSSIAVTQGIAVTRGFDTQVSGEQLFALMPGSGGSMVFARRNPATGRWVRYGASIWTNGQQPTSFRPGLAYVATDPLVPAVGRFYLAYTLINGAGLGETGISTTDGNDSTPGATIRKLRWQKRTYLTNIWLYAHSGVSLSYQPGLDTSLKAVLDANLPTNPDDPMFFPYADGIVNTTLTDFNDYATILQFLGCALTSTC